MVQKLKSPTYLTAFFCCKEILLKFFHCSLPFLWNNDWSQCQKKESAMAFSSQTGANTWIDMLHFVYSWKQTLHHSQESAENSTVVSALSTEVALNWILVALPSPIVAPSHNTPSVCFFPCQQKQAKLQNEGAWSWANVQFIVSP